MDKENQVRVLGLTPLPIEVVGMKESSVGLLRGRSVERGNLHACSGRVARVCCLIVAFLKIVAVSLLSRLIEVLKPSALQPRLGRDQSPLEYELKNFLSHLISVKVDGGALDFERDYSSSRSVAVGLLKLSQNMAEEESHANARAVFSQMGAIQLEATYRKLNSLAPLRRELGGYAKYAKDIDSTHRSELSSMARQLEFLLVCVENEARERGARVYSVPPTHYSGPDDPYIQGYKVYKAVQGELGKSEGGQLAIEILPQDDKSGKVKSQKVDTFTKIQADPTPEMEALRRSKSDWVQAMRDRCDEILDVKNPGSIIHKKASVSLHKADFIPKNVLNSLFVGLRSKKINPEILLSTGYMLMHLAKDEKALRGLIDDSLSKEKKSRLVSMYSMFKSSDFQNLIYGLTVLQLGGGFPQGEVKKLESMMECLMFIKLKCKNKLIQMDKELVVRIVRENPVIKATEDTPVEGGNREALQKFYIWRKVYLDAYDKFKK